MKKYFLLSFVFLGFLIGINGQVDTSSKPTNILDTAIEKNKMDTKEYSDKLTEELEKLNNSVDNARKTKQQIETDIKNASQKIVKLKKEYEKKVKEGDSVLILKKNQLDILFKKSKDSLVSITDSIVKRNIDLKEEQKAFDSIITQRRVEIASQLDSMETIAEIRLKDSTLLIFDRDDKMRKRNYVDTLRRVMSEVEMASKNLKGFKYISPSVNDISINFEKAKILEVHIDVKEGMINEIIVKTDKGIFRNKNAPIDLVHFKEERVNDMLMMEGQNSRYYVPLGNVIDYTVMRSYNDLPYAQFDITLFPTNEKRTYLIKESTSINSYFDVSIFTDIKGISGDANGLAQITANAKFLTNTRNRRNRASVPWHFISFIGGLSKFDDSFKGTKLESGDSINRKDLFQRATYQIGAKFNLIHFVKSPYPRRLMQDAQLNIGYNFVGSKLLVEYKKDLGSSAVDTLFRNITQNQVFFEPIASFNRFRNFSLSLALPVYGMNIKNSSGISNREWQFWATPSINLMYYSKRKSNSKIFLRYNHFINLNDTKLAFIQIQLGYSANLTDVWTSK